MKIKNIEQRIWISLEVCIESCYHYHKKMDEGFVPLWFDLRRKAEMSQREILENTSEPEEIAGLSVPVPSSLRRLFLYFISISNLILENFALVLFGTHSSFYLELFLSYPSLSQHFQCSIPQ